MMTEAQSDRLLEILLAVYEKDKGVTATVLPESNGAAS